MKCRHGASGPCLRCAGEEKRLDAVRVDEQIDDVRRARIWTRLESAIARPAPAPVVRRSIAVHVGMAAFVAAAIAAWVWWPRTAAPPAEVVFDTVEAPPGARIRTVVDDRVHMTLHGPAGMRVVEATPERVTVRLSHGTLVGDFDHEGGGRLVIHSPGATTEIVGTLFAIEARGDGSCVSVAHGTVQVTATRGEVRRIGGGEAWCTDARDAPAEADAVMEEHEAARAKTAAAPAPVPDPATVRPSTRPALRAGLAQDERKGAAPDPVPLADPDPAAASEPVPVAAPDPAPAPAPDPVPVAAAAAAAVPVPDPVPVPVPEPAVTAESLYLRAEKAMADSKLALADALLEKIILDFPSDPLADEARAERGRLAYLACRTAALAKDPAAKACFEKFLVDHPRSPRRAEVLDWLEAAR